MSKKETLLKATHQGDLPLGGKIIDCAVLEDGTRILAATAVFKALERTRKGKSNEKSRADHMPSFLSAKNLQPFVDQQIMTWTNLIPYEDPTGVNKSGYNAKLLRGICKVYLDARNAGVLHKTQEKTAIVCEALLYALADKGIESLVDRATGFDELKEKAKDEVVLFLERSLQLKPAKWVKTFNDEFFEMFFKMKGWNWTATSKRPSVMGHYINNFVYSRIAPNLLTEIQKMNPKVKGVRKKKHHQHLTRDYGHPILREHIAGLIALGRVSKNKWKVWKDLVDQAYPIYGQTLKLDFNFDYVEVKEEPKNLSTFNKSLKQALNFDLKGKTK